MSGTSKSFWRVPIISSMFNFISAVVGSLTSSAAIILGSIVMAPLSFATNMAPYLIDLILARFGFWRKLAMKCGADDPPLSNPSGLCLSVVIPAYKEPDAVLQAIRNASSNMQSQLRAEFIVSVVDDFTYQKLQYCEIPITVVRCQSGRSAALNAGAAKARGDVLVFLHADCLLPRYWDWEVRAAVCRPGVIAGAFSFDVDLQGKQAPAGIGGLIRMTDFRSRYLQLPYGDQALFISMERFQKMGGFADMPLMEDYEFVCRLRRAAAHASCRGSKEVRVAILPVSAKCSARRWTHKGVFFNTLVNQVIVGLYYYLGFSPSTLYSLYYGRRV